MPANSWPENDSCNESDDLGFPSFPVSGWEQIGLESAERVDSASAERPKLIKPKFSFPGKKQGTSQNPSGGRRHKAAFVLTVVWSGTIALHLVSWGTWFVLGLTTLMGFQAVRLLRARPRDVPEPLSLDDFDAAPFVSLVVAAKNEAAVIGNLVENMCRVDYPSCRYELWVIDDDSADETPVLLDELALEYEQLRVFHRAAGAGGGKSGALNQVLPLTKGEIIAVFDADAQIPPDLLRRVLPLFDPEEVGAVQVRKAIANTSTNFLTRSQAAEMALDSYFQQQRIAIGGMGELRGNGQFIRRSALLRCGGFNEETITDDLDLTFRLHLDNWDIDFLLDPAVDEEGVTRVPALWHQRNRWAEGGYQRYLDYWFPLVRGRLGRRKMADLLLFWMTQYFLPTAAVPDMLMAIARGGLPIFSPMTGLTIGLSLLGMFCGLRRIGAKPGENSTFRGNSPSRLVTLLQTLRGTLYMLHWLAIVASVTARMSIRPKRLKWIKTMHSGH
jgi:1,2-diacylglycerol 3-beta-glucosyltransferase